MSLTQIRLSDIKQITALIERKEDLLAQLAGIDQSLAALGAGSSVPAPRIAAPPIALPTKPGTAAVSVVPQPFRRRKLGKLKGQVIGLLQAAGKSGVSVKEIATRIGVNPNRIYTWFYATGKNVHQIKKVGEAKYAWLG